MNSTPYFSDCDVEIHDSGEDIPYFSQTTYTARSTNDAETMAFLEAMPYPDHAVSAKTHLTPALASVVFFVIGFVAGRVA